MAAPDPEVEIARRSGQARVARKNTGAVKPADLVLYRGLFDRRQIRADGD